MSTIGSWRSNKRKQQAGYSTHTILTGSSWDAATLVGA